MYISPLLVVALFTIASAIEFEEVGPGQCLDGNGKAYSAGLTLSVASIDDCKGICDSYDKTFLRGFTFSNPNNKCLCRYDTAGEVPTVGNGFMSYPISFDWKKKTEGAGPVKDTEEMQGTHITLDGTLCYKVKTPPEYILPYPDCSVETADNDSFGNVKCTIDGIESPPNAMVRMTVLDFDDCVTAYDKTKFGGTIVNKMTEDETGVSVFSANVNVDHTSGFEGVVNFCIRTDLFDSAIGNSMVFKSKRVTMEFKYDGAFTLDNFSATIFNGIADEQISDEKEFGVSANFCDINRNTIAAPTLELGEFLYLCISANDIGIVMTSAEFTARKGNEAGLDINANVLTTGIDSADLVATMNLPAIFFADDRPIIISGTVNFGGNAPQRRLENSSEVSPDSANFEMVVDVAGDNSSASGFAIMVTAIFGVAPFFMI